MLKGVLDLLACWQFRFGRHRNRNFWKAILHYLMWCVSVYAEKGIVEVLMGAKGPS